MATSTNPSHQSISPSTAAKITFIGAGSTVFLKNILGDIFLESDIPGNLELSLYDIDGQRLEESRLVAEALNSKYNQGKARVTTWLGVEQRKDSLAGADFVINTIQIGGYDPATIVDFEIPKKYGLRQTIADTLGIGGIFRGLRTFPIMEQLGQEIEQVAPKALMLNYTNPMAIVTGALTNYTQVPTVGLCHSVQVCASHLLRDLDMSAEHLRWTIAGINHMAWLLDVRDGEQDLYPEIKRRAAEKNRKALTDPSQKHHDMVRYEIMKHFGYYITESSEHNAEYTPYWIKSGHPELIDAYNIPLDEYPRRCIQQIKDWAAQKDHILSDHGLDHTPSVEYAAPIIAGVLTDRPRRIHGNVKNTNLIPNLPTDAIVEVPILIDGNGLNPCAVPALPTQCAALNMTNINVQLLTLEAAAQRSKDRVYQAAMLDPHTAAELTLDQIRSLCDELFEAHSRWLPEYR